MEEWMDRRNSEGWWMDGWMNWLMDKWMQDSIHADIQQEKKVDICWIERRNG